MKTIIAGSRSITDLIHVLDAVANCPWTITEDVSGCALGVDTLGEQYAQLHGLPITKFPADWHKHGRIAGPLRNQQMLDYSDALIAIWDGKSKGTLDMIRRSRKRGIPIHILTVLPPINWQEGLGEFEF
jgi:hypothetical protein